MIIKMLSCKQKSDIGRLVDYVLSDKERITDIKDTFFIAQNMYARDSEGFKKAFYDNDVFRKKRKNGVVLYHEVLAFHEKDEITLEILEDITQKYIELRANDGVVLAKPHIEEGHYHVHVLISGTACRSSKVMRITKKKFTEILKEIEVYQLEKYPHLSHSIVHLNKQERVHTRQEQDRGKREERAYQAEKRMGQDQKMDKEHLSLAVRQMYAQAKDVKSFLKLINSQDKLESYFYREKLAGVKYGPNKGRKYRFKTLGITKEMLLELEGRDRTQKKAVIKNTQAKHNLLASVLSEKELQGQLQEGRQKRQNALLETYRNKREEIERIQSNKEQEKQMKILLVNLMGKSKSMQQLLFYITKVGLKKIIEQEKFIGVSSNGKIYNFKILGLTKILRKKQKEFEDYQRRMTKLEQQKDKKALGQEIETQAYLNGFGLFFI